MDTTKKIEEKSENLKFRYVKKTAPSLQNVLVKSKASSLGDPYGKTNPCNSTTNRCKSCKMVSKSEEIYDSDSKIANGMCTSKNFIYHACCRHCNKVFVGKTTQPLHSRVNGHRKKYYDVLNKTLQKSNDDDHLLGLHLFQQHGINYRGAFDKSYNFTILEICNPALLDLKEHTWIQRLKCVSPYGLNSHDTFGITPLL